MSHESRETEAPSVPEIISVKERLWRRLENFYERQNLDLDANRFFWILFIASHLLVLMVWMEFLTYPLREYLHWTLSKNFQEAQGIMVEMYRYALFAYVGVNEVARVQLRSKDIGTPGFYMVGMWVLTGFVMLTLCGMYDMLTIPTQLAIIVRDVVGIFFLGKGAELFTKRKPPTTP